jgi:hypothetical protein
MTLACTSSSAGASGRGRLSRRLHRPVRRCRAPPPAATQRNAAGAQAGAGAAKQRPVRQSMLLHVLSRYPLSVCGFCTCPPAHGSRTVRTIISACFALLAALSAITVLHARPACFSSSFACTLHVYAAPASAGVVATSLPCCLFAFMKCYPHTHCCFCQLLALRHAATSRCTTTASACICVRLPPLE